MMTQREVEKKANEFGRIFKDAQGDVISYLLAADQYTLAEKERILAEIDNRLLGLTNDSYMWLEDNIQDTYKEGAKDVVKYLGVIGVIGILSKPSIVYDNIDQQTVENMVDSAAENMKGAVSGMHRMSSKILGDALQESIRSSILDEVGTLRKVKKDVVEKIKQQGVRLADSTGRKWSPEAYAEMFARTEMMNSYNQSATNQMLHHDQDLAYITAYPSCECDICLAWEGKIVSISGNDPRYPALQEAYDDGVFHPNCYSADTEVYTSHGWKLFKNVNKEDKIMALNPDTHEMEWVDYVEKISYFYEGKMYEFKSNSYNMCVTPDHNMYIGTKSHRAGNESYTKWYLLEADEAKNKTHKQLRTVHWTGEDIVSPLEGLEPKEFAFLVGVYLAEGHIDDNKVIITQSEARKNRFRDFLKRVGFYENGNRFLYNNPKWAVYFKKFGKNYEKYVPDIILEAKPEVIREFLRGFRLGDGSQRTEIGYDSFESTETMYFTSSKRLADQIGECIFKVGHYPGFTEPPKPKKVKFKNGEYQIKHTCWSIRENTSKCSYFNLSPSISHRGIQLSEIDYQGNVYDVELEKYHILLVRRQGKTAWSGNCKHRIRPVPANKL